MQQLNERNALGDVVARLERLERRLEETIAYFAVRANRLMESQSTYLGDHTAVTFLENGLRVLVDTRTMDVGVHLLTCGRWESHEVDLFTRLVKPNHTVFDIGANHGVYALVAAQAVGRGGRVHAFEPNPRLAELVRLSLSMNGFSGWAQTHPVGVSDAAGLARLVFSDAFSGGGAIATAGDVATHSSVECRLVVLDAYEPTATCRVDVVKIDVEGHEGRVLRGMRGILARSPDIRMMMEFSPSMMARSGMPVAEVVALLRDLQLRAWLIEDQTTLTPVGWDFLENDTAGLRNILVAGGLPQ